MTTNFQRAGSSSNAQVGHDFEGMAGEYFSHQGIHLRKRLKIPIGVEAVKKEHAFDLGSQNPKVIVECKSHTWTAGNNTPSAKLTVWNEAMYYFLAAPVEYRKIFFVLRDFNQARGETLAEYYIRSYGHMIPSSVEIWEYDVNSDDGIRLK
jgi:hypothetical protein